MTKAPVRVFKKTVSLYTVELVLTTVSGECCFCLLDPHGNIVDAVAEWDEGGLVWLQRVKDFLNTSAVAVGA